MKRNGVVLHHPYKFTVVNDGNCLCVVRFTHESEAEIYAKKSGGYILPPSQLSR